MKLKLLMVLTIVCVSANWSHAETLVQLRNRVDTFLTNKVGGANGLIARQNAYFAANGKYWQGLVTHSAIPTHDSATVGDTSANRLTFKPTDQSETWGDFLPEWNAETFAAAVVIDVYDGPGGKGWIVIVFVRYSGTIYQRCKSFGPDTSFDFAWRIWDPDAQ